MVWRLGVAQYYQGLPVTELLETETLRTAAGDPDGPRVSALQSSQQSPPKRTLAPKRVLVVEDNLDSVHSLVLLLQDMGHQVDYAINGYAALAIAKKMRPNFVFLDLGLPGLDGFEVCRRIKTDPGLQNARIVAITGYRQEEYKTRSKDAGCELHLIKPVSPRVLEDLLG
jgi:CheY-like chemotaxis protein